MNKTALGLLFHELASNKASFFMKNCYAFNGQSRNLYKTELNLKKDFMRIKEGIEIC